MNLWRHNRCLHLGPHKRGDFFYDTLLRNETINNLKYSEQHNFASLCGVMDNALTHWSRGSVFDPYQDDKFIIPTMS